MKFLLVLLLFSIVFTARAQQFSQFNTGTLFDSFENPAQRAFIPDSSRQFAANFFIPNLGATGQFTGNGQNSIRSLIKKGDYNSNGLTYGLQNRNNFSAGLNTYWLMLKMFSRLDGDQEFGFSVQTKAEASGSATDETLLLLDAYRDFNNGTYNRDLFNDHAQAQAYHQISFTFRKKVSPAFAFGVKLSALLGIYYDKIDIQNSGFYVSNDNSRAVLFLKGKYASSYTGDYERKNLSSFKNPGAAVSFGVQGLLKNGILLQGNLKDLGFIRWNKDAVTYQYNGSESINNIATASKSDEQILKAANRIVNENGSQHAFYSPINSNADLSASKKFNVFNADFYDTPNLIVSKSLFYNDLTAAFVNHFTYKNLWFTTLASYNNERIWNAGLQLMFKTPNTEFYIGTEQLFKSAHVLNTNYSTSYNSTGINAFLGFSLKFGRFIEHPANASYIPTGEESGFFNRMWTRIFKKSNY